MSDDLFARRSAMSAPAGTSAPPDESVGMSMSSALASVLNSCFEIIVIVGAQGEILWTNDAFGRTLGARARPGQKLLDIVEMQSDVDRLYLTRCAGSYQPLPGALTFKQPDGQRLACRCYGASLAQAPGIPVSSLLLRCEPEAGAAVQSERLDQRIAQRIAELSQEVAARRRAEEELMRLNAELEKRAGERARGIASTLARLDENESTFWALVQGVTDYAIFTLDPQGTVMTWNPGAERIKGYRAEEIVGQNFSCFYTEEDQANGVPKRALAIAAHTGKFEAEGWRVRKNGAWFWASVVIDAIYDEQFRLVRYAKITRDLTEKRAAEEQFRQAQKMEAIGQLTGGIAHDFNNLLTAIRGNIELIQRQFGETNPKLNSYAARAMQGAERAASLTHRLLAFSRRQPLDPKLTEINRLVIGMSDLLERTIGEQIKIQTVLSAGLWPISIDPNQFENAVLNLAVNARDAMPDGGKLTIESANINLDRACGAALADIPAGDYVMLAVGDEGCGMTREVLEKAFEPFFTTKKFGEGTGLGLSQAYGFVKQSGGHIKIYSEPNKGTTVRLYFPRTVAGESVDAGRDKSSLPPGEANGGTILVVEDDRDVRAYSVEILRELGYRVLQAGEGDYALNLLLTEPEIKLLFTDVGLPGALNGRQLAEAARKHRVDMKVLFTTGYARNAIVHNGRLDPGVDLIVKPFTVDALAAKVRLMLDGI